MKKLLVLLLAAALLLSMTPAMAEGADMPAGLPDSIAAYFSQSKFNGTTIGPESYIWFSTSDGQQYAYVIVSKGDINTVYGFKHDGTDWKYKMRNDSILPYSAGYPVISFREDVLTIELYSKTENVIPYQAFFLYQNKDFVVTHVQNPATKTFADVTSSSVTYYNNKGERVGRVEGTVARSIGYFNFSHFPKTYSAAKEKLSVAPDIPYNSELTAQNIKFQNGQKYPVYSGPSASYERAANGKAIVSTNDWIQVFGSENGYILIQYAIDSSRMRFGYIEASSLPKNASVAPLQFEYSNAVITQSVNMTDDPLNSQTMVRTLSANQQVKRLAAMGSWVYIEVSGATPIRGFVPASAVSSSEYVGSYSDAVYSATAVVRIENGTVYATVAVNGNPGKGGDNLLGYQLYANNQAIASTLTSASATTFTLSAPYAGGAAVLGLCPVYTSGERADETIIIPMF